MRVRNRIQWATRLGLVTGEDKLGPVTRMQVWGGKWRWRRTHDTAGAAMPVYVVGLQRSGTNMLLRGFETSPEFEVHNEDDRKAFYRFRLRPDPVIRDIVGRSRHRYVMFKPLCDSHRVTELLDELDTPVPGRAIWIYRSVDGRVRSAVATFGPNSLQVLSAIAAGRADGSWQAQGLSPENRELLRSFDYERMTPESAAALFWYVRNSLYFERGLHKRADVTLVSYDACMQHPESVMRSVCSFLGFPYDPRLIAHIRPRPPRSGAPLVLDPEIRRRCDALQARLDEAAREKTRQHLAA